LCYSEVICDSFIRGRPTIYKQSKKRANLQKEESRDDLSSTQDPPIVALLNNVPRSNMQVEKLRSKCTKMAQKMVQHWENIVLNEEEKNDISRKFVKHLKVQKCSPSVLSMERMLKTTIKFLIP
jgi:hypothetical protein